MSRKAIHSDNAPAAIGTYSQAVRSGDLVFLSGQIPLDPATMEFVEGDFEARARQVFDNLRAVFSVHGEPFTVVARADSGVETFDDLFGKRVDLRSRVEGGQLARLAVAAVRRAQAGVAHLSQSGSMTRRQSGGTSAIVAISGTGKG